LPSLPNIPAFGDLSIRENHESGRIVRSQSGNTVEIVRVGWYKELAANIPARGSVIPEVAGMVVRDAVVDPEEGGLGKMRITLEPPSRDTQTPDPGEPDEPEPEPFKTIWEFDMAQLEKPILTHEAFSGYADQIFRWQNEEDPALKATYNYRDSSGEIRSLLDGSLDIEALKLLKMGVETCLTTSWTKPTTCRKSRRPPEVRRISSEP